MRMQYLAFDSLCCVRPKDTLKFFVLDAPSVDLTMTPRQSVIKEGDSLTLTCNVKRSNPKPDSYRWWKNRKQVSQIHMSQSTYHLGQVEPEDSGSYKCTATNSEGTGTSNSINVQVQRKFF